MPCVGQVHRLKALLKCASHCRADRPHLHFAKRQRWLDEGASIAGSHRLLEMWSVSGSAAFWRTFWGTRRVMQATSGFSGSSERPNPRCKAKGCCSQALRGSSTKGEFAAGGKRALDREIARQLGSTLRIPTEVLWERYTPADTACRGLSPQAAWGRNWRAVAGLQLGPTPRCRCRSGHP